MSFLAPPVLPEEQGPITMFDRSHESGTEDEEANGQEQPPDAIEQAAEALDQPPNLAIVLVEPVDDALQIVPAVPTALPSQVRRNKELLSRAKVTFNDPWQKWHFKDDRTRHRECEYIILFPN